MFLMVSLSVNIKCLLSSKSHLALVTLITEQIWKMLGFHMISHICNRFIKKLVTNTTVRTPFISFYEFVEIFRSGNFSCKANKKLKSTVIDIRRNWFAMGILDMSWKSLIGPNNITTHVAAVRERVWEVFAFYVVSNVSFSSLSVQLTDVAEIARSFWFLFHKLIKVFNTAYLTCKTSKKWEIIRTKMETHQYFIMEL